MNDEHSLNGFSEHVRTRSWGGPEAWTLLRRIAEDVRLRSGFNVSAIEVLRGDGLLELVAFTGRSDFEAIGTGKTFSLGLAERVLEQGTRYGSFVFLAEEEMDGELREAIRGYGYVPALPESSDPDDWRSLDMLMAHMVDGAGSTRALLHLDEPLSGRRPRPDELQELGADVEVALLAVLAIVDREELTLKARLDEISRTVVRGVSRRLSSSDLLALIHPDLVAGFRAHVLEVLLHDRQDSPPDPAGQIRAVPAALRGAVDDASRRAWASRTVVVVDRDRVWGDDALDGAHRDDLAEHLISLSAHELLLVPVGAGHEPIGALIVVRESAADRWTVGESHAALDVGHDLGQALLSSRAYQREQQLVEELRRLDEYRRQLLATVSHELMNPVGVIIGHVEALQILPNLSVAGSTSLRALERSSTRLRALVDNLLLLSRMENPNTPVVRAPVDLRAMLEEVAEDEAVRADHQGVELRVRPTPVPLLVSGEPEELRRVLANLVSNGVKYSRAAGTVDVSLELRGDAVVFTCVDDGIGISTEDQRQLTTEFFRSTNPEAWQRPGTGLGLAIVARIVARHGGRLEVESELDVGTTVRVVLPGSPAAQSRTS